MDNQQQEVVKPEVSEDVKTTSTEATENVPNSSVPYSRFSEVNDKYRELEEKFDGLVKEQEAVRQKKLQEEGKFQELLIEKDKSSYNVPGNQINKVLQKFILVIGDRIDSCVCLLDLFLQSALPADATLTRHI